MKKIFILTALLVGALSLGSCVDNKESASVEAIRLAKAKQLESIAAVNNAEAEAKRAMSAVEVALKQIDLDKAKATLATDIEVLKTQAEAALAAAKADLENAKATLIVSLDAVDQATKQRVTALIGKADIVLASLNGERAILINNQALLVAANFDLLDEEEIKEQSILTETRNKLTAEKLIAEYKKHSNLTRPEAEKAADEAEALAVGLAETAIEKSNVSLKAGATVSAVSTNRVNTVYGIIAGNIAFSSHFELVTVSPSETLVEVDSDGVKYSASQPAVAKQVAKTSMFVDDVNKESRILVVTKSALADAKKALTDKKATQGYKDAQKAVEDAQKAFNEATTTADKEQKRVVLQAAETALVAATVTEEADVKNAEGAVTSQEAVVKTVSDNLIAVTGDNLTDYETATANLVAAVKESAKASLAANVAAGRSGIQATLAGALRSAANGLADYDNLISVQQQAVIAADQNIADLSAINTQEELIAKFERDIANNRTAIAVYEAQYADYMKQIEALVK